MLLVNLYPKGVRRRLTQKEVIEATGLSNATVHKMFNSIPHDFRFSSVEKLAKYLGCKALDIIIEIPDER